MPCIINAESGTGLTNSADGSGVNIMSVYWIHRKDQTNIMEDGYIGITRRGREKRRFYEHTKVTQNRHLTSALKKYDDIVHEVVVIGSESYCKEIEFKLRSKEGTGWNIAIGGNNPPNYKGKKRSAKFMEKFRLRKDSDETRRKKSLGAMGNKNGLGSKRNEEQRKKISNWMKGKQNALGKQNGLLYKYIGTNILTGEQITLVGGKPVRDAGFHTGHVNECANNRIKSHKGHTWKKELINAINN